MDKTARLIQVQRFTIAALLAALAALGSASYRSNASVARDLSACQKRDINTYYRLFHAEQNALKQVNDLKRQLKKYETRLKKYETRYGDIEPIEMWGSRPPRVDERPYLKSEETAASARM